MCADIPLFVKENAVETLQRGVRLDGKVALELVVVPAD